MIRRRWTLLPLLLVLGTLAFAALYLSSGDRTLAAAQRAVHALTPYDLVLNDADLQWRPFRFRAEQIAVNYRDDTRPPLFAGQAVELAMPISSLWNPQYDQGSFRARNLTYYLDDSASDEPINLESLLSPLAWLPASITLDSFHVVSQGDEVQVLPLLSITGMRSSAGTLLLSSDAYLGARRIALAATADWRTIPAGHAVDIDATLKDAGSELRLVGEIDAEGELLRYSFNLEGHYEQAGEFLRAAGVTAPGLRGQLDVAGSLEGNLEESTLLIDSLELEAPGDYRIAATGTVHQGPQSSLAIEAHGTARRLEAIFQVPEELQSMSEGTEVQLVLGGDPQAPTLENLAIDMRIAGDGHIKLDTSAVALSSLLNAGQSEDVFPVLERVHLLAEINDPRRFMENLAIDLSDLPDVPLPASARVEGELSYEAELATLSGAEIALNGDLYAITGNLDLLWNGDTFSAPGIDLNLRMPDDPLRVRVSGSAADLREVRGLVFDVSAEGLSATALARLQPDLASLPTGLTGLASLRVTRAAEIFQILDVDVQFRGAGGLEITARGSGRLHGGDGEADLDLTLRTEDPLSAYDALDLPLGPETLEGQLRLRPRYLTALGMAHVGRSDLQIVANADLIDLAIDNLRIDAYATELHLEDLIPPEDSTSETQDTDSSPAEWASQLPPWPVDVSLRAGMLRGAQSELRDFSLEVATDGSLVLLKHFDARYDGGELMLRGSVDLGGDAPQLSLAGRGIHVPLGTLTQDLGLQQSITGDMSFRGGVASRGASTAEIFSNMNGHSSFALNDVTVAGAAYDLLMSNLLAWLTQGAGEKETTFDCTLLDFDIREGIAVSDTIYVDTPRMRAQGKARLDFPENRIDLRIEPRSKSRMFQFPSAVRLEGPLDDPRVVVSPLQAVADLSAQALLLIPSLPLKLFGVGRNGEAPKPCVAATPS